MIFSKPLNSETIRELLRQISQYVSDILLSSNTKLSYQLVYDHIYQLCQKEKQEQILSVIYQSIAKTLPIIFSQMHLNVQNFITEITHIIEKTHKNLHALQAVCLYLDLNYCKKQMNYKIIEKLYQIFLSEFFKRQQILEQLGKKIAQHHLRQDEIPLINLIKVIKSIDHEEQYFYDYFVNYYLPVVAEHFDKEAKAKFLEFDENRKIQAYIHYAHQILGKQQDFLSGFWPDSKKCIPNKQLILKELYEILVSQFKGQIYGRHKQKLLNELTLPILELFSYNPKSNDIQKYAEWYNGQIKEKLSALNQQNNALFINEICEFYNKVMSLLEKTYNKFDIHYRSRFAFQEWINQERLHIPLRLNEYIKEYCCSMTNPGENLNTFQNISVIFILMKEKNAFEKNYRRQLINRRLSRSCDYDIEREEKVIAFMQKQCSEQFIKHISPIMQNHKLSLNKAHHNQHQKLKVLSLNIQNWPYDEKDITTVSINQNLLKLTQNYSFEFNHKNKDKSLNWHPIAGLVILNITFLQSKWSGQLIVNTCMANLLLNFQKTNYKPFLVKIFCIQTGYKPDHLYESIKKLQFCKILVNKGNQDNYVLGINQEFSSSSKIFNVINAQRVNKFESKPLQELKADRKFMVEAIIVKIMKRLKNTDKQTILKEAAPLIEKRGFSFNSKFVENAIERLVDKEFIRNYSDGKYGYIA